MASPPLQTQGLVAGRGRRPITRLPDIVAQAGQAVLVTGPSGSGKSTALFTLAGLVPPFAGAFQVEGRAPAPRDAALIFQDLHLLPGLTVLENVLLGPFARGQRQDRARALAMLEDVGLAALSGRRAETLSRGEAQRASIARALLLQPRLILADEPTASLDDLAADRALDALLAAAASSGSALVIASHDSRVRGRVDRVVQLAEAA
jgi:putative ABC transport system ATP-binding protein